MNPRILREISTTEFCKTAATATTLTTETTMDRVFHRVVAAPFFIWEKGLLPPLLPLFYPKIPYEEEETRGEGWPNAEKGREYRYTEPGNRTGRTSPTNEQDIGYSLMGVWLRPARTTVTSRQSHSYNTVELQFLPDGTKVSTWWNRLKLLVRVRVHTDERGRSYASTGTSASSGKIVGKYRTSGKNKKKWWQ